MPNVGCKRRDRRHALVTRLLFLGFLSLGLGACGDSNSDSSQGEAEIRLRLVEFGLLHLPEALPGGGIPDLGSAGAPRIFENDRGQTVRLDGAEFSVQSFGLFACDGVREGPPPTLLFQDTDDIIEVADGIAQTKTYEVGSSLYCEVRMTVGPTTLFGEDRASFQFTGSCAEGDVVRAFDLEFRGVLEKDFVIMNRDAVGGRVATPLDATADDFARSEDDDTVQDLIFGTDYPALFDGIDCMAATQAELLAHVVAGVAGGGAVEQHLGTIRGFQRL